ncbi:MAG: hypothetical protein P1V34_11045 [Alphaproteobacteria bacterium]|nr:hypothetical protein [Alphaproteobacteria bacterium]
MKKSVLWGAVAALVSVVAVPSVNAASDITDKKACMQAVQDVRDARASASIGTKAKAEVDNLIQVSDHLCTQGNFVYVEKLLQIARGMTAGE